MRGALPELGPRGEGWVAAQILIGAAIGFSSVLDGDFGVPGEAAGAAVGAAGIVLFLAGAVGLGRSLTPFPRPRERGRLAEGGVYRLVRHPIYGGALLVALGWSIARAPWGLIATVVLVLFFELKARREEGWLVERYPGYEDYRRRVRRRFVPWLL